MRISDWSSDVCSSDLAQRLRHRRSVCRRDSESLMSAIANPLPLDALLADARIFRAGRSLGQTTLAGDAHQPSQLAALDAHLPWAGFPRGVLNEILIAPDGVGELSLLLPALCQIARQQTIADRKST